MISTHMKKSFDAECDGSGVDPQIAYADVGVRDARYWCAFCRAMGRSLFPVTSKASTRVGYRRRCSMPALQLGDPQRGRAAELEADDFGFVHESQVGATIEEDLGDDSHRLAAEPCS